MSEGETTHDTAGRDVVRSLFVDRLETSGLQRGKGQGGKLLTEEQHAAMLKRLVGFLSYLSPASLEALAEEVLDSATGPKRNLWPSELVIRQIAEAKEKRPREMHPIVTSWLASIEGPKAEAGGYLVQLFRHLRKHPRPVLAYDLTQIRREAESDRRRLSLVRERVELGLAGSEDQAWLAEFVEDESVAQGIIDKARVHRAKKTEEEQAL